MTDEDEDAKALDALIPAAFSSVVKRSAGDELQPFSLESLKGERVVVRANGFSYRGVLIGADEGELYLRGELRYLVLPLSSVTGVSRERPDGPLGFSPGVRAIAGDEDDV